MDITKLILIGGAAYVAYEYFIAPSTPATQSTGPTAPTITSITGVITQGKDSTITIVVANVQGTPTFVANQTTLNVSLTGTPNTFTAVLPASVLTGTTVSVGVSAANGKAAVTLNVGSTSTTPPATPPEVFTPIGSVLGFNYSTKANFQTAMVNALNKVSGGGNQSIDAWNWFMVNNINQTYLVGGVGPDPTAIAANIGIDRSATCSALQYVTALDVLGLLNYPTGLAGLSSLAAGIHRTNQHPFAGRRIRGLVQ